MQWRVVVGVGCEVFGLEVRMVGVEVVFGCVD